MHIQRPCDDRPASGKGFGCDIRVPSGQAVHVSDQGQYGICVLAHGGGMDFGSHGDMKTRNKQPLVRSIQPPQIVMLSNRQK